MIVGVHGVNNYLPGVDDMVASGLKSSEWSVWLRGQVPWAPDINVAYYADGLWKGNRQSLAEPELLSYNARRMMSSWLEQLLGPDLGAQAAFTLPIRVLLGKLSRRKRIGYQILVELACAFFSEVDTYFSDEDRRIRVRARVLSTIQRHQPRVLVAHSLGSVVAWEVLHMEGCASIDVLVTVGSPLAMPGVVLENLTPTALSSGRPPSVKEWVNIADVGDLIAIPPGGISTHFVPDRDLSWSIGALSMHGVSGYLSHAGTAHEIVRAFA